MSNNVIKDTSSQLFKYAGHLDFAVQEDENHSLDTATKRDLLSKYKNDNTIIVLNGEVIYQSVQERIKVANAEMESAKAKTDNDLERYNKENRNTNVNLNFSSNLETTLFIHYMFSENCVHFSDYKIGENSNITLYESFEILNNAKVNFMYKVTAKRNAIATILHSQNMNSHKDLYFGTTFDLEDYAVLNFDLLSLNSANVVNECKMNLMGEYSEGNINTFSYSYQKYEAIYLMDLEHYKKNTVGNIYNIGVANDFSKLTIDATNKIHNGNHGAKSNQQTKIINLTDTCKAVANPQLYIDNFDVSAGHSVAIGQIDEEQLYYLMSRGLDKPSATKCIVMGLADTVIEKIKDSKIKEQFDDNLNEKLN